jgi:hypothetical protein
MQYTNIDNCITYPRIINVHKYIIIDQKPICNIKTINLDTNLDINSILYIKKQLPCNTQTRNTHTHNIQVPNIQIPNIQIPNNIQVSNNIQSPINPNLIQFDYVPTESLARKNYTYKFNKSNKYNKSKKYKNKQNKQNNNFNIIKMI